MRTIAATVLAALSLFSASASAQAISGGDCAFGSVTNALLAEGRCASSIPLPTSRPDMHAVSSVAAHAPRSAFTYITSVAPDGGSRQVRLVGPRFLPDASDEIHLLGKADQADEVTAAG